MSYTITSKNILKIVVVGGLVLVGLFYYSFGFAQNASTSVSGTNPIITGFSPSQGTLNNSISVIGTNLSGSSNVEFYSSDGKFVASLPTLSPSAWSPTFNITEVFAANVLPGTYQVGVVTNACPGGCNSNRLPFTLIASALSPVAGDLNTEVFLDEDSKNRIVIAGTEAVLAKFKLSASGGDIDIKKIVLAVADNNIDKVLRFSIYDGTTAIASGVPIIGTGTYKGRAIVDGISLKLIKGTSKVITIRGGLNTIAGGAHSGTSFSVFVDNVSYETGGVLKNNSFLDSVYYPEKVLYKTKPKITTLDVPLDYLKLSTGLTPVIRFRVEADPAEKISFKNISLRVLVSGATILPVDIGNVNLSVKDLLLNSNISLANAVSALSADGTGQSAITSANNGFITAYFTNEQVVAAGQYKDYEVSLRFTNLAVSHGASISTRLNLAETNVVGGRTFDEIAGAENDGNPSFIWSDNSAARAGLGELTSDWANGVYVDGLPGPVKSYVLPSPVATTPTPVNSSSCSSSEWFNGFSCDKGEVKIDSISPAVGTVGTVVTISGSNFSYPDGNYITTRIFPNIVNIKKLSDGTRFAIKDMQSRGSSNKEISFIWPTNSSVAGFGLYELVVESQKIQTLSGGRVGYKSFLSNPVQFELVETPKITALFPVTGPRGTRVAIYGSGFGDKGNKVYIGNILVESDQSPSSNLTFTIPTNIENKDYGCVRENPGSASAGSSMDTANLLLAGKRRRVRIVPPKPSARPPKPGQSPVPTPAPGTVGAPAVEPPSVLRCSNIYVRTSDGMQSDPKKDLISFVVTPGNAASQPLVPPAMPHIYSIATNALNDGGTEIVLKSKDFTSGVTNSVYIGQKMVVQNKAADGGKVSFVLPDELRKDPIADPLYECKIGGTVSRVNNSSFLAQISSFFLNLFKKYTNVRSVVGQKVSLTCNRVYFVNGNGVKSDEVQLKTNITLLGK